jgi:hypothetical protein
MVASPPNSGRAHWRGAQDGASGTFPLLTQGRSSADELGWLLAAARKRERRDRVRARVSARASARFCLAGFLTRPLDADGWLTITGLATQAGNIFSGPGPGPGCSVEREWADGPVSVSGRITA